LPPSGLLQLGIRVEGSGRGYESHASAKPKGLAGLVHYPEIKL